LETATFMAGAILVFMGIAKMGAVIRFIPAPVIVGFTSGIGLVIFVGQWRDFLGLPAVTGDHFHERLWHLILALPHANGPTVGLAFLVLSLAWAVTIALWARCCRRFVRRGCPCRKR
jgi:sulfate permease, SulP family